MRKKKAHWKRIIAMFLAIAFVATSIPYEGCIVYAQETQEAQEDKEANQEDNTSEDDYEVSEKNTVPEENTETSTTFDMSGNKKMTVFYQEAVRYKDEKGELVDYDPSLVEVTGKKTENEQSLEGYLYENAQGDKKHYFPEELSKDTPILMEHEDYKISMNPEQSLSCIKVEKEEYMNGYEETEKVPLKAIYGTEEDTVTYEYTSTSFGVKEEIVLNECPKDNTFTYDLKLDGMYARKNQLDEGITLYDKESDDIVGHIASPNMNDATNEAYSEALTCSIAEGSEEGVYHVTVTADKEYLEAKERQYPVVIDPTASWSGKSDIADTYVLNGTSYKNTNFYDSGVVVINAGKGSKGVYRTYMRFLGLATTVKGYYVDSAVLNLYETANSNSGQTVQAYRVKEAFKCNNITWSSKPGYDKLYSSVKSTGTYKKLRTLNLTTYARGVANGSLDNNGIMLKGSDETGHYCEFVGSRHSSSTLRPKLKVVYYDKPTRPTSVSLSPQYLKKGDTLKATWAGISSKALNYVQYRLVNCAEDGTEMDDAESYSSSTKIGTTASGSATIAASSEWDEGIYKMYIRGVDKGGIAGIGRGKKLYIDGTIPKLNKPTITPATSAASPSNNTTPTISWSGASDTYLKQVECKVDQQEYVAMGTDASGSYTLPEGVLTGNGKHTISVRAIDQAGNEKAYELEYYLKAGVDFTKYMPKENSLKIRCDYGKNTLSWETEKRLTNHVFYRIYRGENEGFSADEDSLVAEKVTGSYWTDIQSLADKTYYYKIEVVCTDTEGTIEDHMFVTKVVSGKGASPSALKKKTGSKEYLGYYTFDTPVGNGSIEYSSGNLSYSQEDAELPSSQISFDVTRNYNSQMGLTGMFGAGWLDSLHKELLEDENGNMYFLDSDGSVYKFEKEGDSYQCAETKDYVLQSAETVAASTPQVTSTNALQPTTAKKISTVGANFIGTSSLKDNAMEAVLGALSSSEIGTGDYVVQESIDEEELDRQTATHMYTIKTKDGLLYRFNEGGQLVAIVEPNGTYLFYQYATDGKLDVVHTDTGKEIKLSYDSETGFLQSITLPDQTKLSYTYGNAMLTQASHASEDQSQKVAFQYGYADGKLTKITDGKGQEYKVAYQSDQANRVVYPNQESYELDYQSGKTSMTKKNESGTTIYTTVTEYDTATGKVVKDTDADGNATTYEYGYAGNPYLVTKTKSQIGYEVLNNGKVEFKTEEKVTETSYNEDENVKSETSEDGTITTYSYDDTSEWSEDSPKEVITSKNGTTLSHEITTYNGNGDIIEESDETDADNPKVTKSEYDTYGNVIQETDTEDGLELSNAVYEYDAEGNTVREAETSGDIVAEETTTYDSMGRELTTTDVTTGEVTEYTYDYLGRTIKTSTTLNGKTQTSTSSYDANGTVVKEVDTAGITTEYVYDSINRVVSRKVTKGDSITYATEYSYGDVTVHDGRSERTVKNAYIEKESYPDGSTSSEKYYDKAGKLVKEKANGLYVDYTYDASGNQVVVYSNGTSAQKSDGRVNLTLYNAEGMQTTSISNPSIQNDIYQIGDDTIVTSQEYDDRGGVTKETDAEGVVTEYTYDDSARITQVTQDATGQKIVTSAAYSTEAEDGTTTTTITDAMGHTSVEVTDAAGLTKKTVDNGENEQESITTAYEYDSQGNQTKVTYEDDASKVLTYDERNLLVMTQTYDSDGNQTLQTEYTYDDQQRQIQMVDKKPKEGTLTPYRYTLTGYDAFGRTAWTAEVNSESEPSDEAVNAHKITYTYDAEDKVTGVRYALTEDGGVEGLNYVYDSNRWLISVKAVIKGSSQKPTVREYTYDTQGKVSEIKEYPGFASDTDTCITKTYTYDDFDRVSTMVYKKGSEVLESYEYKYDKNNLITEKTEINNTAKQDADKVNVTKAYTYDALGQLTKTEITDHKDNDKKSSIEYTYDKAGNRIKRVKGSAETTYTYNGLDQLLTAVTERGGSEVSRSTYTYDMNGNQVKESDTKTNTITVNSYDAENRLSKVTVTDTSSGTGETTKVVQENLYNGEGQRICKTEGAKKINYFYQDGVVSYTTEGSAYTKNIQNLLGLEGNIIVAEECTTDNYNYHLYQKDVQGSTSSILDETGTGELSYEYDDFGETEQKGTDTFQNEICYTGGIYDATTGLYYLNARHYDPETGRFLTEDTYRGELNNPDTLHLYAYCKNNPINYIDPSGHKRVTIGWGLGVQVCFGKKWGSLMAGVEFVWFNKKVKKRYNNKRFHVYYAFGAGVNASKMDGFLNKASKNPNKLLSINGVKDLITGNFTISIGCFLVRADKKEFKSYKDYAGGVTGVAVTLSHVSASYAWGEKSTVVGVSATTQKIGASSYMMYYKFWKWGRNVAIKSMRSISSKVRKKARDKKW